jgi:hypothetical protein
MPLEGVPWLRFFADWILRIGFTVDELCHLTGSCVSVAASVILQGRVSCQEDCPPAVTLALQAAWHQLHARRGAE